MKFKEQKINWTYYSKNDKSSTLPLDATVNFCKPRSRASAVITT